MLTILLQIRRKLL